ncbi:hypothetical protein TASIC1_0011032500 [Trichoderma asperellum]|uniref:NACHT-NTPase and P-loop NTPases N-terminal domain-containing protein n=1 Tax=Trichoderma asperellum TaxID=101201 RepID=A0A6V8R7I2_TRIAP|nr:hypothetical protein TASIC1_0011032500 [Trichoderma asperellum]
MPGPVATEVVSLVRATMSKLESVGDIYGDTDNAEGLPPAFHEVGKHVSTVYHALKMSKEQILQRKDDSSCAEMKPSAEDCKRKADCLEKLFSKVVPSAANEKMENYRMAVRELGNESRVETLMRDAMEDVKLLLTVDDEMQLATKSQLELLVKSIEEVSAIPQSLQDESPTLSIQNNGSGPQNVCTGNGPQNNNNGLGMQVNGGTFHNINPFLPR